ncbi:metal-dependent hydrolase [Methylobacillus pratensis]
MFIAHAPAGYIMATMISNRIEHIPASVRAIIIASIIGSIAPDFDLSYFYLIDHRQIHHHQYFMHWPIIWFLGVIASAFWIVLSVNKRYPFLVLVFFLGGMACCI